MEFLKKFVPKNIWEKGRNAILYRAEDPHGLLQILPPRVSPVPVERIKGFRYPSPGSRPGAKIPIRETEDELYDTNNFKRDPSLLPREEGFILHGTKDDVKISLDIPRNATHGKRKISLLPYDPSGLRTTKTVTFESLDKVLAANAKPDHLIQPSWWNDRVAMEKEREDKGLPPPVGRHQRNTYITPDSHMVRW